MPTLALLKQWYSVLSDAFGASVTVGLLGGGYHEITPLTVTTYDSAYIHAERYGDRFALVVYDEVHHLPAPKNAIIPKMLLAPYSLGSPPPPSAPTAGTSSCPSSPDPSSTAARPRTWPGPTSRPSSWCASPSSSRPTSASSTRQADAVYRDFLEQAPAPDALAGGLAAVHHGRRDEPLRGEGGAAWRRGGGVRSGRAPCGRGRRWRPSSSSTGTTGYIVFTKSVEEVYALSRRFLIPGITYETPARERKEILDRFREGRYRAVIASDVLNEGVDVPDANVAVILAGSASRREYVQRLGRILRPREGKRAILYELITGRVPARRPPRAAAGKPSRRRPTSAPRRARHGPPGPRQARPPPAPARRRTGERSHRRPVDLYADHLGKPQGTA